MLNLAPNFKDREWFFEFEAEFSIFYSAKINIFSLRSCVPQIKIYQVNPWHYTKNWNFFQAYHSLHPDENMWNLILTNFITFSPRYSHGIFRKREVLMKATVNLQPDIKNVRTLAKAKEVKKRKKWVAFLDFATCRHKMRNNVIIVKNTWHTLSHAVGKEDKR